MLAIARIAVPVAVVCRKIVTATTTVSANTRASTWVVVTIVPPSPNVWFGNGSSRGFDVSHRSFMMPIRNSARATMPSDFASESRLDSLGARNHPYARVSNPQMSTSSG